MKLSKIHIVQAGKPIAQMHLTSFEQLEYNIPLIRNKYGNDVQFDIFNESNKFCKRINKIEEIKKKKESSKPAVKDVKPTVKVTSNTPRKDDVFKFRKWQEDATKVIDRCVVSDNKELISIPACVGSGKTTVCAYGFGKYIQEHRNEKTVQMFVSPRIKLCEQQTNEISEKLKAIFNLENGVDYNTIRIDCTQSEFNRSDDKLNYESGHVIFIICDQSLWGEDKLATVPRFAKWINHFNKWEKDGWTFGCCVFDEAHNYEKKQNEIFGHEISKEFNDEDC